MNNMKNVAIFTTAYLPHIGGAEIAIREITRRLPEYSFDIFTAKLNRRLPSCEIIDNVTIYRVGFGFWLDKYLLAFWGHRFALRKHNKKRYDLVWGVMASFGGLASRNFKKKDSRVPFLLNLKEGDKLKKVEKKGRFMFGGFKDIFRTADHIQAISSYLADWAYSIGVKSKISVIPNGINIVDLSQIKPKRVFTDGFVIITTSRLVEKNGIDILIKSLSYLPENYKLLIIGSGKQENYLKTLSEKLNFSKRIIFYGSVSPDEINSFLSGADIFCRPSRDEGLGNSFLEAMACGIPVVGTSIGGIKDFLFDNQTGWVVPIEDPRAIAEKVVYITTEINDPAVKKVTENARKMVYERYDWDKITQEIRENFSLLIV